MRRITWQQANARRLHRHGLAEPVESLPHAAAAMAGAHAQVMSAAEVSLCLRVAGTTRSGRARVGAARRHDVRDAHEAPPVRLLPYFDAFGVGSQPRSLLFPGRAAERALAGSQAGNFPVLLIDGVVGGVWHQKRSGRRVAVTVEPLARLSKRRRQALEGEVERLGMILEAGPELTIGPISVGPHA